MPGRAGWLVVFGVPEVAAAVGGPILGGVVQIDVGHMTGKVVAERPPPMIGGLQEPGDETRGAVVLVVVVRHQLTLVIGIELAEVAPAELVDDLAALRERLGPAHGRRHQRVVSFMRERRPGAEWRPHAGLPVRSRIRSGSQRRPDPRQRLRGHLVPSKAHRERQRAALAALQLVQIAVSAGKHRDGAVSRISLDRLGEHLPEQGQRDRDACLAAADRRDRRRAQPFDLTAVTHRAEAAKPRRHLVAAIDVVLVLPVLAAA